MVKEYNSINEAIKSIYGLDCVPMKKREINGGDINRDSRYQSP